MSKDVYRYFRVEARELVDELGRALLALDKGKAAELIPHLLRLAHTLKGAARVVKHRQIAEHAHTMEELVGRLRDRNAVAPSDVDALLKLLDAISAFVVEIEKAASEKAPVEKAASERAPLAEQSALAPVAVVEESLRTVRADVAEMDLLLDGLSEATVQLGTARRALAAFDELRQLAQLLVDQIAAPRVREATRVGTGSAMAGVRSLGQDLKRLSERLQQNTGVALDQTERELQQVRDAAERLRLLPAAALFAPLERTLRDVSRALGKPAAIRFKGGDLRLDAHVLEQVQAALVQMVRNAVAHGIESDAERVSAGKPVVGQVEVEVTRRGNRVAFVCRDDGRGVDVAAVKAAAQKAGLPGVDVLGEPELLRLLMKGGLSTSRTVTELSGRGIGLDIVREAAQKLGGEALLQSERARGTKLELVVPVSVSSLDTLVVEADGVAAAIPLAAVRHTLRVGPREITHTPAGDSIVHEGRVIPFVPLLRALRGTAAPLCARGIWSTVLVQGTSALAAVGVDRLLGTTNMVVRPLPALAPADPVIAGASLDAAGMPRLVLDPEGLVAMTKAAGRTEPVPASLRSAAILVIDDSLTTRMLEQSILEAAGYEVELATSAEEGLEKALARDYGLFLVDVEMPGMDGFTFIETTRADARLRDVPAILVSSRSAPEDLARGRAVGAHAYVVKGEFDQGRLLETIRGLLSP